MPPSINYNSSRELRAFLDERGLGMRKKFGQNFLVNPAARSCLLDALEFQAGDDVWEIGPGLGAMTFGLLERGARITAFEIDTAFIQILKEIFSSETGGMEPDTPCRAFRLIEGDVMKTWKAVFPQVLPENLFLLGNLPYNLAAALLADFIENRRFFKRIVVTVQREVAQRMAAGPGSSEYSSFSVLCSSVYKISPLSVIKSSSFYPIPRVDSQGVRLDLLPLREERNKYFYPLVRSLFSSRRKTIRNTLSSFVASVIMKQKNPSDGKRGAADIAAEVFNRSGLSGERRPETLGIHEFTAIASFLEETLRHG